MTDSSSAADIVDDLISRAKKAGADAADAVAGVAVSLSHAQRLGKMEKLERSEEQDLGLRVFVGPKQAVVSSNDWSRAALDVLIDRAIAMAKAVPDDPYAGIADPDQILTDTPPDLDMNDPEEPSAETLIERARETEDAARAMDGITNSEGAEADWARWTVTLGASNGFLGTYEGSRHSIGVSVIAGEGTEMEGDYDFTTAVHGADLKSPTEVGERAARRALSRLAPRKPPTGEVPVVFDPRISSSLVRHLASAVNGAAIARGTSFLQKSMGEMVMAPGLTITDDPHRPRGLGSKPFDAEGIANAPMDLVSDGVLKTWILDLRTARQLGLKTTARASRGAGGPPNPSTTNLYLHAGAESPEALIADIDEGLYITSLMGMGVNGVTGDYSRGAAGFWIEKGEKTYPVSEVTIAGNLKDMFKSMTPADDLTFEYGTNAPTIHVARMTVAGM